MNRVAVGKYSRDTSRRSRRGGVIVEFVLMIPIYLLLIGGALLTADLLMGKLYVLEGNRNLAWGAGDMQSERKVVVNGHAESPISEEGRKRLMEGAVRHHFLYRNALERKVAGDKTPVWSFGDEKEWLGAVRNVHVDSGTGDAHQGGYFKANIGWGMVLAADMDVEMAHIPQLAYGAIQTSKLTSTPNKHETFRGNYSLRRAYSLFDENGPQIFDTCLYLRNRYYTRLPLIDREDSDTDTLLAWSLLSGNAMRVIRSPWPGYYSEDEETAAPNAGEGAPAESEDEDVSTPRYKRILSDLSQ